jgi:hypothetical protein
LEKKPTVESKNGRLAVVVLVASEEIGWWRGCVVVVHGGSEVVVAEETAGKEEGRERELSTEKKNGEGGWFLINFALKFLHHQNMKPIPIYNEWKRDILYLIVSNLDL